MFSDQERSHIRELFHAYQASGSPTLRATLVEIHLGLAEHLARRFANRGIPVDDLIQVASVGLLKAVDRFEFDRGLEFTTFATPTIVGELKRHFRDKGWSVRIPRRVQELHVKVNELVASMTQDLGRSPTIAELAEATEASEEEVIEAMEAGQAYRSLSLDAPSHQVEPDMGPGTLAEQLIDDADELGSAESRMVLEHLLESLPARERLMVQLRFFEGMTQAHIAERLGISQMHVSRLLTKSLEHMRHELHEGVPQTDPPAPSGP